MFSFSTFAHWVCFYVATAFLLGCSDENTPDTARSNSFKNAQELDELRKRNQALQWENSRLKLIIQAHTVSGDAMVFSNANGLWYLDMHREPFTGRAVNKFNDGTIKDEANFLNGKLDGVQRFHHRNGQVRLERQVRNGQLHGYVTEWNEQGKIINRKLFERGKEINP